MTPIDQFAKEYLPLSVSLKISPRMAAFGVDGFLDTEYSIEETEMKE